MNFKKIEKIAKVYEKIKELDAEIIAIDKMAMLAANGEIKASFELKIEDLAKKDPDVEKSIVDEDGSLTGHYSAMMRSIMPTVFSFSYGTPEAKKDNLHTLKQEMSENLVLNILGVVLCEKGILRDGLIAQIEMLTV